MAIPAPPINILQAETETEVPGSPATAREAKPVLKSKLEPTNPSKPIPVFRWLITFPLCKDACLFSFFKHRRARFGIGK